MGKFVYITAGNFPSQWAHSRQILKMAEAFSSIVEDFQLVTSCGVVQMLQPNSGRCGLEEGSRLEKNLVRIPVKLNEECPFHQNYFPKYYTTLASIYAKFSGAEVLYTRSYKPLVKLLSWKKKVWFECHAPPKDLSIFRSSNLKGLITTTDEMAEIAVKSGLPRSRTLVFPNCIDLNDFKEEFSKDTARKSLNLKQDAFLLVYSGHLYDHKGIPLMLEFAKRNPSIEIVLVGGWNSDVLKLKEIINEKGIGNMSLVGHQNWDNVYLYLKAADVLLLPTSKTWEEASWTSPLKLFEYMASERAIVASDLPNICKIINHRKEGMLFSSDDICSFEAQIADLRAKDELREEIANNALQKVQQFSWKLRAKKILDFIYKHD